VTGEGWLVRVEVQAGKGELAPYTYVVAIEDYQAATEAARNAPEITLPRANLGNRPPLVERAYILNPVDARTLTQLGLAAGGVWNLHNPPMTDRISFAVKP
jgi:hypothetical protein